VTRRHQAFGKSNFNPMKGRNEMNAKKSYAEYLKDWKNLLGQMANDPTLNGAPVGQRQTALTTLVAGVEGLLLKQSELDASKQSTSEEIRLMMIQGRELSRDIKLEMRGRLGARAVELVKYKVAPLRKRRSKTPQPETPAPESVVPVLAPAIPASPTLTG
jgi:DNA-binding NarL/FixJ family response regulator